MSVVALDADQLRTFLPSFDSGSLSLDPTAVWMPNSKEYFQYWINLAIGSLGLGPGYLQKPFFFLESPRGSGKFEYPGFPAITFKH